VAKVKREMEGWADLRTRDGGRWVGEVGEGLLGRVRVRGVDGYLLDIECILVVYFSSNGSGNMLF
jgi:hypothetical protein